MLIKALTYTVHTGWQTGTNTTTGPTQVRREDRPGSYVETLTMSATPGVTSSKPDGSESVSSIQSLSRQYTDNSGRAIASDVYFDLTGVTYSTSANIGTLNTNYYRTTYDYDSDGRRSRGADAVGTITHTGSVRQVAHIRSTALLWKSRGSRGRFGRFGF